MTLYELRGHFARWVVHTYDDGPVRWPTKAQALAYAEGLHVGRVECDVSRRGPGIGRSHYYYPGTGWAS